MDNSYTTLMVSIVATLATSLLGTFFGYRLAKRGSLENDYRVYLTKIYAEIMSEYFLMIDGRSSRSKIVASAKQALLLCSDEMKPYLKRLIRSVIYIKDIYHDDLSEFHAAYAAFEPTAEKEVIRLWTTSLRNQHRIPNQKLNQCRK